MDMIQLYNFQALAKTQHVTQAAHDLNMAQSALSRSLKRLEAELGVTLFDRVGKYIQLNECGQIFLRHAEAMLSAYENAKLELGDRQGKEQAVVLSMYAGSKLLPEMIRGFQQKHANISLRVIQQGSTYENMVQSDITVYCSSRQEHGPSSLLLMEEGICLALPAAHPLAKRKSVRLIEVASEPFICLHQGKGLRIITDDLCRQAGFRPNIVLESDSPGTVRDLISVGVGFAFIPKISWPGMGNDPNVALVEIEEPVCSRFVMMKWKSGGYMTNAAAKLKAYLIEFFREKAELSQSVLE